MSCKATINEVLLRFGFIRPDVPVQDAAGTPPKPSKTTQSLQAHDKQYHPNGWKPGDKCRLRDSIFNVDDLGSPSTGQGQQQSQQGQATQAVQPNNQDFPTESEFETVIGLVNANPRLVPPMLKQALDDLPKKIFDLAENQEYLDDAIADLPDGEAKDSLLADQQDLEKERMKLRGEFLQTYRVLSSILGTKKPEALTRNPALKHDPSQFPTTLDTTPTVNSDGSVDISFDGTSYHFTPCANGSTGPVEGTITINGQPKQFILKLSNKAGTRHAVPPEALKNEQAASEMLRKAGLNAPDAVVFEKNGQVYRLAEKIEPSTGLDQTPITQDIQRQLREAYPLLDLMYSHDAFRNDNIRVDQNGKVWFVDNGSSFAFKGYGDKKSASNPNWKGFDFEQRNDAAGQPLQGNDGNGGQKMYPAHYGALYESQKKIQKYLGQMTTKDLLKEASRYNMTALVAGLPKESKCQALEDFAASLDKLSAKAAGTRKVKSSLKPQKTQPAQGQATGQNQAATTGQGAGASQQQSQAIPVTQQQYITNLGMPQGVGAALVGAGADLRMWTVTGGANSKFPEHWFNDVIDSNNNQTAVNMMTQLQSSLPAGYSAALYDENGINGICVFKTSDKQQLQNAVSGVVGWPNGGFQQWIDGGQGATTASTSSASSQGGNTSQQQAPASTGPSTVLTSGTNVPSTLKSLIKNVGFGTFFPNGAPSSIGGTNMYSVSIPQGGVNKQALQTLANNLPQGLSVTTHSNGNAYIINTADYQSYWSNYNHQIVQPQTQTSGGSTASGSTTQSPSQTTQSTSSTNPVMSVGSGLPQAALNTLTSNGISVTSHGQGRNKEPIFYVSGTLAAARNVMSSLPPGLSLVMGSTSGNIGIVNTSDLPYWTSNGRNKVIASSPSSQTTTPTGSTSQPTATTQSAMQTSSTPTSSNLSGPFTNSYLGFAAQGGQNYWMPSTTPQAFSNAFASAAGSQGILSPHYRYVLSPGPNGAFNLMLAGGGKFQGRNAASNAPTVPGYTKADSGGYVVYTPVNQKQTPVMPASTTASKQTPAASQTSQQQPASKPTSAQPSSSSSGSSTATSVSTPKFTYGSAGSLVKSGGFNDGNISTDISNLISSTGLQSAKGKILLAPGTKLKTQGSIANNGDLYIGLPAGTKKSDLQAIANHLNNEYGQYGYSAYPMGGSWISIEPIKQNTIKPKQTATAPAASTPKPAQAPASTPATSQTPPPASMSTRLTQTATTNPGGNPTSQPASTAVTSNQTTGQTSATPTAQTAVPPPPRKTLSQMIQQRLASANPQQQARFQAALNRANGNSGIPPQPQTTQGASQQPQTASKTSGQPTTPSGQQSQQTASTTLLTAPKSGNQPTPAQQKTIARFQHQIQNARTPTQKAAFQQALSRYFGAI